MLGQDISTLSFEKEDTRTLPKIREIQEAFSLCDSVCLIKGIGNKAAERLKKLGIERKIDLITHQPRSYLDFGLARKISDFADGELVTFVAEVASVTEKRVRFGLQLLTVMVRDESGVAFCVWFNQSYVKGFLRVGQRYVFSGKARIRGMIKEVHNPTFERADDRKAGDAKRRIFALYPLVSGLKSSRIRGWEFACLKRLLFCPDIFPQPLGAEVPPACWPSTTFRDLYLLHFPLSLSAVPLLRERLKLREAMLVKLSLYLRKQFFREKFASRTTPVRADLSRELKLIPFALTASQRKALDEIMEDLSADVPMNRLLQGEVGSGKTIVAFLSMFAVCKAGLQASFMAPTEVLAFQHFDNLRVLLDQGVAGYIRPALLTRSRKVPEDRDVLSGLKSGELNLVVGTHALIQEDVEFKDLGMVVIDEQHRFGVMQRLALRNKGMMPHMLIISATPIPRSVAQVVYGDMEISTLEPIGLFQRNVETLIFRGKEKRRVLDELARALEKGGRAYVVCPVIDDASESGLSALFDQLHELMDLGFGRFGISVLHGRMGSAEKMDAIWSFKSGASRVLLATTVVEVGVDIRDANYMLILNAERFGLSQLHQLRGRIGRSGAMATCMLVVGDRASPGTFEKLELFAKTRNGLELALQDLKMRGEGDIFGVRQSGVGAFKFISIPEDLSLLMLAERSLKPVLVSGSDEPAFSILRSTVSRLMPEERGWIVA